MKRSIAILTAIGLGLFLPAAGQYAFTIRYNLMVMLFFTFLDVRFSLAMLRPGHAKVLALNLLMPLCCFGLLKPLHAEVALAVFAIASAPTAAVAPAITGFLRGNVAYVAASVLLTSPMVAVVLPFTLHWVGGQQVETGLWEVAGPTVSLVFIPLGLAWGMRQLSQPASSWLLRFSWLPFVLFLANVFIASASASGYLAEQGSSALGLVAAIAVAVLLLCVFQFWLGERLGRPRESIEMGMSLGRKNTMFGLWLSLTFISPLAALGPVFYIFAQNIYNSWQIYRQET